MYLEHVNKISQRGAPIS